MRSNFTDGFFLAASAFYVSALMHLVAAALSHGEHLLALLFAGIFWGVLATALLRRIRGLGWLGFIAALGAGLIALGYSIPVRGLSEMVFLMITVASWLGALSLAFHLWRFRGPFRRL
ncbi:hypothetical protein SAMN06297129_1383 [Pseudooceanicola antarcticus]|uniref:Uncharacterized protein n=1 Tax=Pseudooceanicola antarcticus TaxID=1247613 RepID=A0A285IJX7_9RHOB|nr:hypothetical protein [Pseudooceanicola antarcticus]PJE28779.1 hypothetical protein CVM39_09930 [Pseudooceanicola antarcticus]SNY48268.1 hypothetical protein SAMN06297129_1383 [Pseudooceanicola antarcticus]